MRQPLVRKFSHMVATSPPVLAIRHASKRYGGIPALMDAALDLAAGEVHALVGENGAGKSTLIKLLAGATPPDTLELRLDGVPIHIHSPQAAYRFGLRFIHQELNVIPQLSVAENIFINQPYPRRLGILVDWRTLNQRAMAMLARLGIDHIAPTHPVARLSVGDQMLVKIASAVAGDEGRYARVYVMDEPTAALTAPESARLFRVIRELQAHQAAVLYVSHRMDEIFALADRITVMRDGRVITTLPAAATSAGELIRLMTGRALEQVYPPRSTPPQPAVLLEVTGLTTHKLRDVHFQVRAGEIVGVAGLQGAGRTALLRALIGAERILAGQMRLQGQPVRVASPVMAWRAGLAFTPEERRTQGLILTRSIRDNVTLPHLGRWSWRGLLLTPRAETQRTAALGQAVRLRAARLGQSVYELSGGNQQKVLFARAIARQPRVLLLDEPTRGVDVGAKYDLYTLMAEASAAGTGILLATSELGELIGLCDRILVLRQGRLAHDVAANTLTQAQLLALCYGETHGNRD